MKAIVLAGGLGTRLASLFNDIPKPMAPINGKPFLSYVLDNLASSGFTEVCIAVCHLKDKIIDYFGSEYRSLKVYYSEEHSLRGTGGAICDAAIALNYTDYFVVNGDTYLDINYMLMKCSSKLSNASLTMAVSHIDDTFRYGQVLLDANGMITGYQEKGSVGRGLINLGVYYITNAFHKEFDRESEFSFEEEVLKSPYYRNFLHAKYFDKTTFIDIGIPDDYRKAEKLLSNKF